VSGLSRIVTEARIRAAVNAITRDPDPEPTHDYQADPQSGAGNCVCGMAEAHRRHPHAFRAAASDPTRCVCALPAEARCHR
jgi:hypothetical protein